MNDKKKEKSRDSEPKVKLYKLTITREFEATSIDEARARARKEVVLLGQTADKADVEDAVQRVVRAKYSSRADRLAEALSKVNDAVSEIESLKDECQSWYDNLPENFQNGDKGSVLQDAVSALEDLQSNLESAASDGESVEFPGMFD